MKKKCCNRYSVKITNENSLRTPVLLWILSFIDDWSATENGDAAASNETPDDGGGGGDSVEQAMEEGSNSQEEEEIEQAIEELEVIESITLETLLRKAKMLPALRTEPEFMKKYQLSECRLFEKYPEIVIEMVEWTLMPKSIARRSTTHKNIEFYTFQSK